MAAPLINTAVVSSNGADTTTKDFTSSGFGTPKAALFWAVRHNQSPGVHDGSTNLEVSAGAYDGTNSRCNGLTVEDASADGDVGRYMNTDAVLAIPNEVTASGTRIKVTATFIAHGVQLSFDGNATAYKIIVKLFNGADLGAVVGTHTPNSTQNGSASNSSLGINPDLVIVGANAGAMSSSTFPFPYLSWGAAWNSSGGIVQRGLIAKMTDEGDASGDPQMYLSTSRVVGQLGTWDLEITGFGAGSFTSTTRTGGTSGDETWFLALEGSDQDDFEIGTLDCQTASGDQTWGASGYKPQSVFGVFTALQALDSTATDGTAECIGFFAHDGSSGAYLLGMDDDAAATITTGSKYDISNLLSPAHITGGSGADIKLGALAQMETTGGWTVTWAGTSSNVVYGFYISVKETDAGAGGGSSVPVYMHHYRNMRVA